MLWPHRLACFKIPPHFLPPSPEIVALSSGDQHTCVLLRNGTINCWGFNGYGALGTGDKTNRLSATAVSGLMMIGLCAEQVTSRCLCVEERLADGNG